MTSLRKFSIMLLAVAALAGSAFGSVQLTCNTSGLPSNLVLNVGTNYNIPCSASGGTGANTFTYTGTIPSGMGFYASATQVSIQGIPALTGTYAFTVTVTDAASTMASVPITLTVGTASVGGSGTISLTSITSSTTLIAGQTNQLTLNGSGFTTATVVYFNGNSPITPSYGSSNVLYAVIPSTYLIAGSLPVYVHDPTNGTSGTLYVTVSGSSSGGSVSLSSISPTSVPLNTASTLTFFGSGFAAGQTITIGSNSLQVPNGAGSTSFSVTVPGTFFTTSGNINVSIAGSNTVQLTVGSSSGTGSLSIFCSPSNGPSVLNQYFSQTCSVSGGVGSYNWTVSNLPSGVTESGSGTSITISGYPNITQSYNYSVQVNDSVGHIGTQTYSGTVSVNGSGSLAISSLSPNSNLTPGATIPTLIVNGSGFTTNSIVYFNGIGIAPQFQNSNLLYVTIPGTYVVAGQLPVYVLNSSPAGTSNTVYVSVGSSSSSVTLTSISPTSVQANTYPTITFFGTGFSQGQLITIGGNSLSVPAGFSSTQFQVTVPASYIPNAAVLNVSVGGSNTQQLTVTSGSTGALTITCSPASGPSALNISYTQTCSVSGGVATYYWTVSGLPNGLTQNGSTGTSITITGTPSIAAAYSYIVSVTDSSATRLSGSQTITGNISANSGYFISSLSPSSASVGSPSITMSVLGGGFTTASQVFFNNAALSTTYVSSTQLNTTVPSNYLTTATTFSVTVSTSGVATGALTFTVGTGSTTSGGTLSLTCTPGIGPSVVNTSYSTTCTVSGGVQPYNWPAPAGFPGYLTYNTTQGSSIIISGTPNVAAAYNYTVRVNDSSSPTQTGSLQFAGETTNSASSSGSTTITSISPTSAPVGSAAVQLTVIGSGFVNASVVVFNGFPVVTTYVSATQLIATVPSGQFTFAGSALVTVTTPGAGASNGLTFIIGNGGVGAQMSISCNPGVGPSAPNTYYASACAVNGGTGPYTWSISSGTIPAGLTLSPSSVTAQIAGYVTLNGPYSYTLQVTDSSSTPNVATLVFAGATGTGSGTTTGLSITSVSPTSTATGSGATTITVIGSNFTTASVVNFNGSALPTTFVNTGQLTAIIPQADLTSSQTASITVYSGGVTSNSVSFTVGTVVSTSISISCSPSAGPPAPGAQYLSTCTATGGKSPYAWAIVNGVLPTGLVLGNSTGNTITIFGYTLLNGTYNYTLQVTDSSTVPLIATFQFSGSIGTAGGSGGSAGTITSLSPASVGVGAGQFSLTITGTGFVNGSSNVYWNIGTPLLTTYISPTQLSAIVPASYLTTVGTYNIDVQTVGVGTTNTVGFFVTGAGAIAVAPQSLSFTYGQGGSLPPTQGIAVTSSAGVTGYSVSYTGSSNNIQWLVPYAASGGIPGTLTIAVQPGALPIGVYTGSVTLTGFGVGNPVTIPVTLTVSGAPSLAPTPSSLTFATGAGSVATTQTVNVASSDGNTVLPYSVTATANNGGTWLTVTPNSGSTPGSFTVTATAANLTPSTYSGSITLKATGALPSVVSIPVTFKVSGPLPNIAVSPASLTFNTPAGVNPAAQNIAVTASDGSAVAYTTAATTASGGNWLSATANGTTPGTIAVSINTTSLAIGTYSGTVSITTSGASNSPLTVPVTLVVSNAATLSLSPQTLTFNAATGGSAPPSQTVSVATTNGIVANFTATSSSTGNWLSATASGTTPGTVTVSVNQGSLAVGSYTGTVTVTSPGATNSPQTIQVTLTVSTPSSIFAVPGALTFTVPGDGSTPAPQIVTVLSSGGNTAFTVSAVSQGGNWLTVSGGGQTPGNLTVTVNPAGLSAGQTYNGSISISAPASNPSTLQIPVTLTLAPQGAVPLTIAPASVNLSYTQGAGTDLQHVIVLNSGGGTVNFTAAAATQNCGNWLSLLSATGSATASTPGVVGFNVNPSGLTSQTCRGTLTVIDNLGNSTPVTVVAAISSVAQSILLSQTAMNFQAFAGGTAPASQTFQILNPGSGSMLWNSTTSTLTGGSWLSVAPNSGSSQSLSQPGSPISVSVNPQGLAPGTYYGTVQVTSTGAFNSPQQITVTLTILPIPPTGTSFGLQASPGGVIITGASGTSNSQTVTIGNPGTTALTYSTFAFTDDGGNWLVVNPSSGSVPAGSTSTMSLSANLNGLSTGLRHGTLRIVFSNGSVQTVDVQLVLSGAAGAGTTGVRACGSSNLAVEFLSPAQSFAAIAQVAVPVQVVVTDCSGNLLTSSNTGVDVLVGGSSTDVRLIYTGNGIWAGIWTPSVASTVASLTAEAIELSGGNIASGSVTVTGNAGPPAAGGPPYVAAVVNAASFLFPGLVAPGTMVSIFGSSLTDSTAPVFSTPFPSTLAGAQFTLRGSPLPIFYGSNGQVNAIIPIGITANERDQLIVIRDTTQSVPINLLVADTDPGIFAINQQGTGQGAILVGGTSQIAAPAGSIPGANAAPATRGQFVSIFLAGLGAVANPPADGSPAGSGTSTTTTTPTVTIGGVPATVAYSGLAPGEVGLYQINVQVPAGAPTGNAVPVVVTAGNGVANTVTIAVQ